MNAIGAASGPDFLVIGAQRAGTTWLHKVLSEHPALWLTPVKELHYFDKPHRTRTWLDPHERRRVQPRAYDLWHLRYLFGRRSDEWYSGLFHKAQSRGYLAGESTPDYAVLNDKGLQSIRRVNSKVKLIFVLRDPVDRAWSAANNAYRKDRLSSLSIDEALAWAALRKVSSRSTYVDTIRRVETIFSPDQLHCGFFDDLRDRPEVFVADVLEFLGIETDRAWAAMMPRAANASGQGAPMPIEFARSMAERYLPAVEELCKRFEGPPVKWRARYYTLLNGASNESAACL